MLMVVCPQASLSTVAVTTPDEIVQQSDPLQAAFTLKIKS